MITVTLIIIILTSTGSICIKNCLLLLSMSAVDCVSLVPLLAVPLVDVVPLGTTPLTPVPL